MKFQPSAELKDKYDHSSKDKNVTIHYNVIKTKNINTLDMAVQNTGSIYMSNFVINYDECCQNIPKGSGEYNYINLGSMKNRTYKTMKLKLPSADVKTVKLNYNFIPVQEDGFLKTTAGFEGSSESQKIDGTIIIYVK